MTLESMMVEANTWNKAQCSNLSQPNWELWKRSMMLQRRKSII